MVNGTTLFTPPRLSPVDTLIYASSGEFVGNWRGLELGLNKEAVQFPAGGVEGTLLVL